MPPYPRNRQYLIEMETAQSPFDKFMDDLLEKQLESARRRRDLDDAANTPQREYIKRYSETPGNRIKVGAT